MGGVPWLVSQSGLMVHRAIQCHKSQLEAKADTGNLGPLDHLAYGLITWPGSNSPLGSGHCEGEATFLY